MAVLGSAHAQTPMRDNPLLPAKFIPKSPTVSDLPRFDAQQLMQLHSGAAQYSIPLVNVTRGSLSLPVSLAYFYNGLRVSQPSDLVGLGWTLQAGASITRQVSGLVDDQVAAVAIRRYHPDSVLRATARLQYLKRAFNRDLDTGPDVYSFSLPTGVSGRFVFVDTSVVMLPQQPVFIRRVANGGFQVSTEDGVRYLFQVSEFTTPGPEFGMNMEHVSAWHLSRVISADAADTLALHYTAATVVLPRQMSTTTGRYYTGTYQELGDAVSAAGPGNICGSTADYTFQNILANLTLVRAQFLESITARGVCLQVNRQLGGPDLVREIRSVQWLATGPQAREVRHWDLFQSRIYEATSNGPMPDTRYRLRLDSLRESANGTSLPAYRFSYLPIDLMPTKGSAAQDYWGYFNGAVENGDLANKNTRPALLADTALLRRKGMAANREPQFDMVAQGALSSVRFPTGGEARWDYELNRIAVQSEDLPLREHATYLEASYVPAPVALVESGPLTHYAFSSPKQEFDVPNRSDESGRFDVRVLLHRQPYDSMLARGGSNQVRDFSIWRRQASGDSLITKGLTSYRIFDGQLDDNHQPVTTRTYMLRLPPGRYVAQVHCEATEVQNDIYVFVPYLDSTDINLGLPGPGIRVWRTTSQAAGAPPLVRTYRYSQRGSCSGVSLLRNYGRNFERQKHTEVNYQLLPISSDHPRFVITACEFWDTTSDNRDLGDEFSRNVHCYNSVQEEGGTNNGLTVHYFGELSEQFNDVVPFGHAVYRRSPDNQLQLAESTAQTYDMQNGQTLPFIRVRRPVKINLLTPGIYIPEDTYESDLYLVRASFAAPVQTVRTRYDEQGHAHTTTTRSTYAQQRLVRSATQTSTAGWDIQHYKRLSAYAPSPAVTALRGNHFNPVVETQWWRQGPGAADSVLVGGDLTFYDLTGRQPVGTWDLRLAAPVAGPNAERKAGGAFASFKSDTRYAPSDSVRYEAATGLLLERRPPRGLVSSYLWGYNQAYLVAQVTNATYVQLVSVLGAATVARLRGPNPGSDAQVRQLLQPLRSQLPAARVMTYTHLPLVGETSQTGPDGRTTYYEYDALGRLVRTRDEQGRILSQQQYHYAGH